MLDARLERADAVEEPNNEEFSQLFATIKIFAGICDAVLERRTQTVYLYGCVRTDDAMRAKTKKKRLFKVSWLHIQG